MGFLRMMQDEPELSLPSAAERKQTWSKAELLDLISRSAGATMAVIDRSLAMIYVNEEYARWFGTAPERLVGKTLVDVYGEQDCARFMPFVERVLRGERVQYQRMLRTPYGFDEWRTICLTPWHNSQGAIDGFITTALDVHELQVTMNALRAANQRLSSHIENSPLAVLEMDHKLQLLHCSQRAVQLMGWLHVAGLEGRLLTDLLAPASMDDSLQLALSRLKSGEESQNRAETSFVRGDGTEVHCEWFNSALTDEEGQVTSIMALVQDVSAKIQIARQQHYLANHDSLTGLLNRAAFQGRLEQSLLQARSSAGAVALLFIDLDGFKRVNDAEGHHAGDEVLRIGSTNLNNRSFGFDSECDVAAVPPTEEGRAAIRRFRHRTIGHFIGVSGEEFEAAFLEADPAHAAWFIAGAPGKRCQTKGLAGTTGAVGAASSKLARC